MIFFITLPVMAIILGQAYMSYRAKKVHEFCLTDQGRFMTIEKANKLMRQFWKWPIKLE